MKKDFNTRYKEAEYEIVLNHLYVGGWGKPVADLYNMIMFWPYWIWELNDKLFCLFATSWEKTIPTLNIKGNSLDRFGDIWLQKAHLYKQCGLNQHCRQVDCDDCLEDEADKLGRNNDDQGVVMRSMLKTMPRRRRPWNGWWRSWWRWAGRWARWSSRWSSTSGDQASPLKTIS